MPYNLQIVPTRARVPLSPPVDRGISKKPDSEEAFRFFRTLSGPPGNYARWHLATIDPEGGAPLPLMTLDTGENIERAKADLRAALHRRRSANVYYHAAELRGGFSGAKAKEADVVAIHTLWVDIDPQEGEAPNTCKERGERALAALAERGITPLNVVDSGSGLHVYFRTNRIELPDQSARDRANSILKRLAVAIGGDAGSPANVATLLRVPGTMNRPNKGKQEKGRRVCRSVLLRVAPNIFPSGISTLDDADRFVSQIEAVARENPEVFSPPPVDRGETKGEPPAAKPDEREVKALAAEIERANASGECRSACNFDPLSRGIGVQF